MEGGINFCVFSRGATAVALLLFDEANDSRPSYTLKLDPAVNRTWNYWHVFIPGLRSGQLYGYRVDGPWDPDRGMRFDASKLLLDPYGRGVAVPDQYSRDNARRPGDNAATAMKSVVIDPQPYDWEGDAPLRHSCARTIVYEVHVRGFTHHPSSEVSAGKRGTYAGFIEKIPYLKRLGITAVELLPVFQFDWQDSPPARVNYWGYAPVSFFAPHGAYSSRRDAHGPIDEFRDMVKALHRAGIEVILDVVYNHTAEGNEAGPTFCYRGFGNETYYMLETNRARYADFSGTGNTLNANQPIVRRLIVDSLRYWVEQMHVDGFRFDLASVLSRDETGQPMSKPPILWDIESDPVLAGTKLIAEAWDAAGLYQVGGFGGEYWREWNGRFRDDARSFLRGEDGSASHFADRMVGSPEIYAHQDRDPEQSINFVTCHDGFTLNDLVSYDHKHNESNGESNRDGTNDNRSWNCGVEGPTADTAVERLRNRQVKNFFAVTLLAIGIPMILMGDELRRTQGGNNNAYCQDNETSWLDWTLLNRYADVHRFVAMLNERRLLRDREHETQRLSLGHLIALSHPQWHGVKLHQPDWSHNSHTIAFSVRLRREPLAFHCILNAYWEALEFELPLTDGSIALTWKRWIDTALASPEDITDWDAAPAHPGEVYRAQPRSVVVLLANAA